MRILHIVHQYPPDKIGGTELYTQAVSRALSRRGHTVAVFYRRDAPGRGLHYHTEDGSSIYVVWDGEAGPARRFLVTFGNPWIYRTLIQVVDGFQPDVVHIQHLVGVPASIANALGQRAVPLVITLHDYWWLCPNAQLLTNYSGEICAGPAYWNCARCILARVGLPGLWPASPFLAGLVVWRNRLLERVLDAAEALIAPTEFVRHWYGTHGVQEGKIVVLTPGLDALFPPQLPHPANGTVRFAYIGGLAWQKGVHVLVEAFSGVRGNAELWIAGDESFDPAYSARLRALATSNIRFLGHLDRERVWRTLAQVDAVVVPSLWYETFSFLISEAFAAGLPVLASRLGPLADRVRDGVDGLLLPPGNVLAWRMAMQRLLDDPALLPRLRAGVRPPPPMEEHAAELEALYAQICTGV